MLTLSLVLVISVVLGSLSVCSIYFLLFPASAVSWFPLPLTICSMYVVPSLDLFSGAEPPGCLVPSPFPSSLGCLVSPPQISALVWCLLLDLDSFTGWGGFFLEFAGSESGILSLPPSWLRSSSPSYSSLLYFWIFLSFLGPWSSLRTLSHGWPLSWPGPPGP